MALDRIALGFMSFSHHCFMTEDRDIVCVH